MPLPGASRTPVGLTSIRRFYEDLIEDAINPSARERDKTATAIPRETELEAARSGLVRLNVPKRFAGLGLADLEWGKVLFELGYLSEDLGFCVLVGLRSSVCRTLAVTAETHHLTWVQEDLVPRLVSGEVLGSFAYTEQADPFSFHSQAERLEGGWCLTADKEMVTGAVNADLFMVYIGHQHDLRVFIVEKEREGVSIEPVDLCGVRSAGICALKLDQVFVPDDHLLVPTDGLSHVQQFLNPRRNFLSASVLGMTVKAAERCAAFAQGHIRHGRPISTLSSVQATLGRMHLRLTAATSLLWEALAASESGERFDVLSASAKWNTAEVVQQVLMDAMRVTGGHGYKREAGFERYLRDTLGFMAGGGAQPILETNVGAWFVADVERRSRSRQHRDVLHTGVPQGDA